MNIKTVSISVNYLDLLSYTWSYNRSEVTDYTIITDTKDKQTQNFCTENNINLFTTDSFYKDGAKFSKSNALNDFFSTLDADTAEWILLLDSDIIINGVISAFQKHYHEKSLDSIIIPNEYGIGCGIPVYVGPKENRKIKPKLLYNTEYPTGSTIHGPNDVLVEECLFGCPRQIYNCKSDHDSGSFELEKCYFYGYFHLFHISSIKSQLVDKEPVFDHYTTAAKYDMDFARTYWSFHQKKTLQFPVQHLGPIAANWEGRQSDKWS